MPTDVAVCAYWLQALAEAHVCLAAKEQSRSVDLLGETLDICGKLFARGDERLGKLSYSSHLKRSVQITVSYGIFIHLQ